MAEYTFNQQEELERLAEIRKVDQVKEKIFNPNKSKDNENKAYKLQVDVISKGKIYTRINLDPKIAEALDYKPGDDIRVFQEINKETNEIILTFSGCSHFKKEEESSS